MGGSPCSGKSSITDLLAARYALHAYHCDDHYTEHLRRADPVRHPELHKVPAMTWNEIWGRTIEKAVLDEFEFYRQEFGMILEDLLAMPPSRPIIAEGASLIPECVVPLLSNARHAAWVVPTAEFQLHHYSRRSWVQGILDQCDNPQAAFATWQGRDIEFGNIVEREARALGLLVIRVDGSRTIEEIAEQLAGHFGLEMEGHTPYPMDL